MEGFGQIGSYLPVVGAIPGLTRLQWAACSAVMYLEQTGSLGQEETHRLVTNASSEASFNLGLHHLSDLL